MDPFIGKYSMIKDRNPVLSRAMMPFTMIDKRCRTDSISKLYVFEGSKPIEVQELHAGDIGAIAKLDKATYRRYPFY